MVNHIFRVVVMHIYVFFSSKAGGEWDMRFGLNERHPIAEME